MIFHKSPALESSTAKPLVDSVFFVLALRNTIFKKCVCENWLFLHIDLFALNFYNAVDRVSLKKPNLAHANYAREKSKSKNLCNI